MIAFFICAALLVVLTLGVLGWSVLRVPAGEGAGDGTGDAVRDEQTEANVAIAREQLAALDAARTAEDIDERTYADERERLERSLAGSLADAAPRRGHRGAAIAVAALVGIGVPIATGVLYLELGQPEAMALGPQSRGAGTQQAASGAAAAPGGAGDPAAGTAGAAVADDPQAPALAELLPQLEAKLAERPDDVEGWRLLGRTYLNVEQFDKAAGALDRAVALAPNDVDLLASLAEARAMRAGGTLTGDALGPLEQAYALDPMHEQTLWLLGIARQEAGNHPAAIELFTRLRGIAVGTGNAQAVATIDDYLNRSRAAEGLAPVAPGPIAAAPSAAPQGPVAAPAPEAPLAPDPGQGTLADDVGTGPTGLTGPADGAPIAGDAAVEVSIALSDEAAAAVDPAQSVFVFARASDGPPIPLAVARLTVADLPATVRLDESMAMMPTMTLGTFPSVTVGARVSASGEPAASPGDWFDEEPDVAPAGAPDVALVIDRQVP